MEYEGQILTAAELSWKEGQTPCSDSFDDIYYPQLCGLEASRYIFFEHNQLPRRWKDSSSFSVGEIGFGSGLNFLVALKLWQETSSSDSWLHFVSTEKFPLDAEHIKKAISAWPELNRYSRALCQNLPYPTAGFHRVEFPEFKTSLTLLYGEATQLLQQLNPDCIDAWILDGFAPAKNPELWSSELCAELARCSKNNATFATYTSAGFVRRNLEEAGFETRRFKGFANKRESLCGEIKKNVVEPQRVKSVGVVGAGLAGSAVAHALSQRGLEVTVYEASEGPATKASGNPRGIALPYITQNPTTLSSLYTRSFGHAIRGLDYAGATVDWKKTGVVHFPSTERLKKLYSQINSLKLSVVPQIATTITAEEVKEITGIPSEHSAFHYPNAGYLYPAKLVEYQLQNSTLICNTRVTDLKPLDNRWELYLGTKKLGDFDAVVIASAFEAKELTQTSWIPVEPVRGQIIRVASNQLSQKLKTVLCYDGYVTPEFSGTHLIGASYSHHNLSTTEDREESIELIERLGKWVELGFAADEIQQTRVGFRTSTYDRAPLVGAVPEIKGDRSLPGLYLAAGFGSRGVISSNLCAELIYAQITETPNPIEKELVKRLAPLRWIERQIKKGLTTEG